MANWANPSGAKFPPIWRLASRAAMNWIASGRRRRRCFRFATRILRAGSPSFPTGSSSRDGGRRCGTRVRGSGLLRPRCSLPQSWFTPLCGPLGGARAGREYGGYRSPDQWRGCAPDGNRGPGRSRAERDDRDAERPGNWSRPRARISNFSARRTASHSRRFSRSCRSDTAGCSWRATKRGVRRAFLLAPTVHRGPDPQPARRGFPAKRWRAVEQSVDHGIRGLDQDAPVRSAGFHPRRLPAGLLRRLTAEVNLVITAITLSSGPGRRQAYRLRQKKIRGWRSSAAS